MKISQKVCLSVLTISCSACWTLSPLYKSHADCKNNIELHYENQPAVTKPYRIIKPLHRKTMGGLIAKGCRNGADAIVNIRTIVDNYAIGGRLQIMGEAIRWKQPK